MRPISLIPLFSSCVSTLVLQPLITPAPQLAARDVASNICGYYSLLGLVETISCDIGTPCLIATNLSPAVGYCSGTDSAPITSIYPYGGWPSDQGCGSGEACCPLLTPAVGKYLFNGGSTVFLGCGSTSFDYTAFFATPAPSLVSAAAATRISNTPGTTTTPNFGLTTSPALDSTATPTTPRPSQTSTSSGSSSSSTTLIVVVVGAVVALISGIVFLWFLYLAWKLHYKAKYPQQQPYLYQSSNPSLNSVPQVKDKKSGLGKWSKIVTIISPIFAIAGVVVSVYFGLRQK